MKALLVALLFTAAVAAAAPAVADPDDHVPYCSGDQTPMDYACRMSPSQEVTHGSPGANPDVPVGLTPGSEPAI